MSTIEECGERLSQKYSAKLARLEETGGLPLGLVKPIAFDFAISAVISELEPQKVEALLALSREKGLLQSTDQKEVLIAALKYCYHHRPQGTT